MLSENVDELIVKLYNEEKWQDIANLSCTIDRTKKYRSFWVLPSLNDLKWMTDVMKMHQLYRIMSIGCGCGLIEWMFKKYSGFDVVGVELDSSWWSSKYAPPLYLQNVIFISEKKEQDISISNDYALLFCYFNNGEAFRNYLNKYEGCLVFVIGPTNCNDRSSDPLPFDEKFQHHNWKLLLKKAIMNDKDYIAVYTRS